RGVLRGAVLQRLFELAHLLGTGLTLLILVRAARLLLTGLVRPGLTGAALLAFARGLLRVLVAGPLAGRIRRRLLAGRGRVLGVALVRRRLIGLGLRGRGALLAVPSLLFLELLLRLGRHRRGDFDHLPGGVEAVGAWVLVVLDGEPVGDHGARLHSELGQVER